ncbi:MAG: hypothetical protein M1832_002037 [Thelocarpon impressellum]|nr:MAG: hypothetical protein M1832_002037 [Thelocarpon impressellum]
MTNGAQSAGPAVANRVLSQDYDARPTEEPSSLDDDEMVKGESEGEESDLDHVTDSFGVMKVDANKSMYFGDAHWATIINDIAEVKNFFSEHKKQFEEQSRKVEATKKGEGSKGPAFLFGTSAPASREELFAALPPRSAVDKMVSRYFNSFDPAVHVIHGPTFRKQYEAHWATPAKTQVIWLGQLFAIMCLAMQSHHRDDDEPPEYKGKALQMANDYRKWTAECVALADFCKPVETMIETLILHLHGEFTRSKDSEVGLWVIGGMIVRLAMRMGYHRDPKPFTNITPFQGEMRRRVWTFVRQMDVLFSFQIGLPAMIRTSDCDTAFPRNLYDDEFGEAISELPPSRPSSEPTPVSYMRAKATLAFKFGEIIEQINVLGSVSYEGVMKLDQDLRDIRTSLPPHLQLRSMDEMMLDPATLIMQRFSLDLLYLKGQAVLHRKFLTRGRVNPRYAHSRRTCVDASMELLRRQITLQQESQPTGRLRSVKWFVSSLTSHDFMLACMVVCLELFYGTEADPTNSTASDLFSHGERRADMIRALETSRHIWADLKEQSMEAWKAYTTLTIMLEKLEAARNNSNALPMPSSFPSMTPSNDASMAFEQFDTKPEHSAAMTLGLLSSGGLSPNPTGVFSAATTSPAGNNIAMAEASGLTPNYGVDQSAGLMPFSAPGTSSGPLDGPPVNLNWDAWDSFVQNSSLDPAMQFWPNGMDFSMPSPSEFRPDGDGGPQAPAQGQQDEQQQQQQQHDYASSSGGGGGGVFMGVNTPNSSI